MSPLYGGTTRLLQLDCDWRPGGVGSLKLGARTPRLNLALYRLKDLIVQFARSIFLVGLGFVMTACSVRTQPQLCLEPGDVPPDQPFELTVELSATEVTIGDKIQVTYHLLNKSDEPACACPVGWDNFHVINNATKANRGLLTTSTGGAILRDVFRLPPHTTLTWVREVEMPDTGVGEAQFLGKFNSGCWLWSGQVWSKPVPIRVVASRIQGR